MLIKSLESLLQITTFTVVWQFETSAVKTVVWWRKLGEVENECTSHNFSLLPSFCQKLWKLVEIWRSSDKNKFAQFLDTVYIGTYFAIFGTPLIVLPLHIKMQNLPLGVSEHSHGYVITTCSFVLSSLYTKLISRTATTLDTGAIAAPLIRMRLTFGRVTNSILD